MHCHPYWLGLGVTLLLLQGCQDPVASHDIETKGLVYCGLPAPSHFNPQQAEGGILIDSLSSQLFDRLIELDDQFVAKPMLATDWQISADGREYTFTLRDNVQFHQNHLFVPTRALNAEDVVFSFEQLLDSPQRYPWFDSMDFAAVVAKVEALGSHQVKFTLAKPHAGFLSLLASRYAVVHSKEYAATLAKQGELEKFNQQPIGTGAFYLAEFIPTRQIRLKSHANFWGQPAQLEQISYDIAQQKSNGLVKFIAKECDILSNVPARKIPMIKQNTTVTLLPQLAMNVAFLSLNTQHPLLAKLSVRRAINAAIDKQALVSAVYDESAQLAKGMLPPMLWAYDEQPSGDYNLKLAKSLLAQAGLSQGFSLDLFVYATPRPYNPNPIKMAKLIQTQLKEVNIRLSIVTDNHLDSRLWQQHKLNLGMVLQGWIADNADPNSFLRPLLGCSHQQNRFNLANWCDPQFNQLLDNAMASQDQQARDKSYQALLALIKQQLPVIPLAHGSTFTLIRQNVKGYQPTPFGDNTLATVFKEH